MSNKKKIMLLMKNTEMSMQITQALEREQFDVFQTQDIAAALRGLNGLYVHFLIIDREHAHPEIKRLMHAIKEDCHRTGLIIIMNTENRQIRIQALDDGADACISKPIDVEELVAKMKAILRRIDMVYHEPRTLAIHDIEINLDHHEVRKDGHLIDLTYTQFKLLYLLASRREYVFTRDEILQKVWGEHAYVTDRTVDVHVKRLREKLGEYQGALKYIQTIHGLGYRFA